MARVAHRVSLAGAIIAELNQPTENQMPRHRRFDPDPEINKYVGAWHRVAVTAFTALVLFVSWVVCAYLGKLQPTSSAIAVIARLFATAFGWLAVIAAVAAAARAVYAWFYPPWRGQ